MKATVSAQAWAAHLCHIQTWPSCMHISDQQMFRANCSRKAFLNIWTLQGSNHIKGTMQIRRLTYTFLMETNRCRQLLPAGNIKTFSFFQFKNTKHWNWRGEGKFVSNFFLSTRFLYWKGNMTGCLIWCIKIYLQCTVITLHLFPPCTIHCVLI